MVTLLAKIFIKDREDVASQRVRTAYGFLCGIVGIIFNVFLFAIKLFAGLLSGSVSVTADAFNNLSDAGSSVVTLLGFKMSNRQADEDHPFGHGRMEYISALIVSIIIVTVGFELFKESVSKIFSPSDIEANAVAIVIIIASIFVKFYMAFYNNSIGKKINSNAMKATATDSFSDCIATGATLAAILVSKYTSLNIDGYCGVVVSVMILIAGFNSAKDTIAPLLGQMPSKEFVSDIEKTVMAHEGVKGIHDLVVHDYGPGRVMMSLHAEVSASEDVFKMHDMIDNIEVELCKKFNCEAVIHMDPIDDKNELVFDLRQKVSKIVKEMDDRMSIHDFRMVPGPTHTNLIFDIVIPFDCKMKNNDVLSQVKKEILKINQTYFAVIKIDKMYA